MKKEWQWGSEKHVDLPKATRSLVPHVGPEERTQTLLVVLNGQGGLGVSSSPASSLPLPPPNEVTSPTHEIPALLPGILGICPLVEWKQFNPLGGPQTGCSDCVRGLSQAWILSSLSLAVEFSREGGGVAKFGSQDKGMWGGVL